MKYVVNFDKVKLKAYAHTMLLIFFSYILLAPGLVCSKKLESNRIVTNLKNIITLIYVLKMSYFFQTADEIARENENIQTEIRDLQDQFDQALSSDSDKVSSA